MEFDGSWEKSGCKSATHLLPYRSRDHRAQIVHQTAALPNGFRGQKQMSPVGTELRLSLASILQNTCRLLPWGSGRQRCATMLLCCCVSSAASFPADPCLLSSAFLPDVARAIELLEKLQESGDVPGHKLQSLKKVLQSEFCTAIREVGDEAGGKRARSKPVLIVTDLYFSPSAKLVCSSALLLCSHTVTSRSAEFCQKMARKQLKLALMASAVSVSLFKTPIELRQL